MGPIRSAIFGVAFFAFSAFGTTHSFAGFPVNLSQRGLNSTSFNFQVTPDGSRVTFFSPDTIASTKYQVYSVPVGGGTTPIVVNGTLPAFGSVFDYRISPNGLYVMYGADQDVDSRFEKYVAPTAGGSAYKVNGPLVAGGNVFNAAFSPLSNQIAYVADQNSDEVYELYRADMIGGVPQPVTKVNPFLPAGGDVDYFKYSPDGGAIVYYGDVLVNDTSELFGVPTDAVGGVRLNKPLLAGAGVSNNFEISPDGSHVLYVSDADTVDTRELFTSYVFGGLSTKLNQPLAPGGQADVELYNFGYSPDGSRVLYLADDVVNGLDNVFTNSSLGGTPVKLNPPLAAGGTIFSAAFTPDSSRVVYVALQDTAEIFSVPATGGTAVKLNKPLVAGGDVDLATVLISPDSARVIYVADADVDNVRELYSVPIAGGDSEKLNIALGPEQYVDPGSVQVSPDSSRVLYYVNSSAGKLDLYIAPSEGGASAKVNVPVLSGGVLPYATFTPDGSRVVFSIYATLDGVQHQEVFSRVLRLHSRSGGGGFDFGTTWDQSDTPDEVTQVFLDAPGTVSADGQFARTVNELSVGGGNTNSTLQLSNGATVVALNRVSILSHGIIRGDGQIVSPTSTVNHGELRAGAGQRLGFSAPFLTNSGLISALGNSFNAAEFEYDGGAFTNANDGLIVGQNSTLRFTEFLTNYGSVLFSGGNSSVFGPVFNFQGRIVVSGGATVTFFDDVNQSAALEVLKAGSTTSVATFAGAFTGTGGTTGGGDVIFLGDLRPGASPAIVTFANNVTLAGSGALNVEMGGLAAGSQYDRMNVVGQLALEGALEVSLINGFTPAAGNSFDILDWTSLTGTFSSLSLPALAAGLQWNTSQLYATGVLSVISAGVPGDYNNNGIVDAGDYVLWRKGGSLANEVNAPGTVNGADYAAWRARFGNPGAASGDSQTAGVAGAQVPEPSALIVSGLAGVLVMTIVPRRPRGLRS